MHYESIYRNSKPDKVNYIFKVHRYKWENKER